MSEWHEPAPRRFARAPLLARAVSSVTGWQLAIGVHHVAAAAARVGTIIVDELLAADGAAALDAGSQRDRGHQQWWWMSSSRAGIARHEHENYFAVSPSPPAGNAALHTTGPAMAVTRSLLCCLNGEWPRLCSESTPQALAFLTSIRAFPTSFVHASCRISSMYCGLCGISSVSSARCRITYAIVQNWNCMSSRVPGEKKYMPKLQTH